MLNRHEIEEAIAELENRKNHSDGVCARLADLYAIRDHAFGRADTYDMGYSCAAAPVTVREDALDRYGDSEFLLALVGKAPASAWSIIDDLMDNLRVVNPRVYDSYMRKIRQL